MLKKTRRPKMGKKIIFLYVAVGVLFGLLFPIGAAIFELVKNGLELTFFNIIKTHNQNNLLYIIDTAPIFLGLFSLLGGVNRYTVEKKKLEVLKLSKEKDHFLGMVSHDLRNPISVIVSVVEFLEKKLEGSLNKNDFELVKMLSQQGSFAISLLENLLDITKIELEGLQVNPQKVNYVDLLDLSVKGNRFIAQKKEIEIYLVVENEKIELFLDQDKIIQVLNNLISNAVKYSGKKTVVKVEVMKSDKEIITCVCDKGVGIHQDEQQKIFNPFYACKCKYQNTEKRTGLGLSIVKKIIEAHKGTLRLKSEPGKGSSFCFTLPYYDVADERT